MNQTKFNYEEELSKCTSMNDITGENGLVQKIIKNAMETLLQNEFNNFINLLIDNHILAQIQILPYFLALYLPSQSYLYLLLYLYLFYPNY